MGRELHRAGIATDAIEQTLSEIAATIGLDVQSFALPTYITIAIGPTWSQRTMMMRLEPGRVSLRKIALINELYDALRNGRIDYRKATILLGEVDAAMAGFASLGWKSRRWPSSPWASLSFSAAARGS